MEKVPYIRSIEFLQENGLLEPMVNAAHIIKTFNDLPIEAVAEKTALIEQLFGSVGSNASVETGFH